MLRYVYRRDLEKEPDLMAQMFRCRADQFKQRLGWDVAVNANGEERDGYDDCDPLYIIWQDKSGNHCGSMRFLPTSGPVMVNDVFSHLLSAPGGVSSPEIWEATRFCLERDAEPNTAITLMLGGSELMRGLCIKNVVGVFDKRMERIYRAIGWSPDVIASDGDGPQRISVGIWQYSDEVHRRLCRKASILPQLSRIWLWQSLATGLSEPNHLSLPSWNEFSGIP